jgi:hypothetical protein
MTTIGAGPEHADPLTTVLVRQVTGNTIYREERSFHRDADCLDIRQLGSRSAYTELARNLNFKRNAPDI